MLKSKATMDMVTGTAMDMVMVTVMGTVMALDRDIMAKRIIHQKAYIQKSRKCCLGKDHSRVVEYGEWLSKEEEVIK